MAEGVDAMQGTIQQLGNIMNSLSFQISNKNLSSDIEAFHGSPEKFKDWIKSIEKYCLINQRDEDGKMAIAFQTSRGVVSDYIFRWQSETNQINKSWASLKRELIFRFSPIVDQKHARNVLRLSKQKQDESIIAFSTRLYNLSLEAYDAQVLGEHMQEELTDIFIDGIRNQKLRFKLMERKPATFEQAVKIANEDQHLRKMFALRGHRTVDGEEDMEIDSSRKQRNCYYCGKLGHSAANCRQKLRQQQENKQVHEIRGSEKNDWTEKQPRQEKMPPRCYYCNQPGHFKRECKKWQRDGEFNQGKFTYQNKGHINNNRYQQWTPQGKQGN